MITKKTKPVFAIGEAEFETLRSAQGFAISSLLPLIDLSKESLEPIREYRESAIEAILDHADEVIAILKFKGRKPREAKAKTAATAPKVGKGKKTITDSETGA